MRSECVRTRYMVVAAYQISQYVDFVKEHFLLILVHMALSQHLNCSLGPCISVHTHSHFSEGAYAVTE